MQIITLLNEKGGVGKTTLATHISAGLALRGWRVVLADADPQGHATLGLGLSKEPGLYELLVRNSPFQHVMRSVPAEVYQPEEYEDIGGKLYVIPSNIETRNIANSISDAFAIEDRFRSLESSVDIVIFDTSPTPSLLHGSIYLATDFMIYPTKCEFLSFDGLSESMAHRDAAQSQREKWGLGKIHVMGIVPTMYRASTLEHSENLDRLRDRFGELVWPAISQRTIWAEAAALRQPVFAFAPNSNAAKDAWGLVERVESGMS